MLSIWTILARDGLTIADVTCRHDAGIGDVEHYTGNHSLVFVRRGCFVRNAEGAATVLDPTVAYCLNPGEEQRIDHPYADGDDCTVLGIDDGLLGQLAIDGERLPRGPLPTSPEIDLEHRLLIATARRGGDEHELTEKAFALTGATIKPRVAEVKGARRHTAAARKALVADAREALVANADLSLADLAHELAVSPFHLSRTFRSVTGHTLARHRVRLRARRALERLAGGERDLARLAADIGFADQSYMCRVIRAETGRTPAALRDALS